MQQRMNLLRFWAKTSHVPDDERYKNAYHPLICHMIDVACVARAMWDAVLPLATKKRLAVALGMTCEDITCPHNDDHCSISQADRFISFLAGLHDLGKCSPPFALRGLGENKNGQTARLLALYKSTPFDMPAVNKTKEAPHGYVTTVELPAILSSDRFNFNPNISKHISTLIGGHHGVFPSTGKLSAIVDAREKSVGNEYWKDARIELVETLARLLKVEPLKNNENQKLDNGTVMILAGLVSVADWIGSDGNYFGCAVESSFAEEIQLGQGSLAEYLKHAEKQAEAALKQLGWIARNRETFAEKFAIDQPSEEKFKKLFPFIKNRRHLQDMAMEISEELKTPGIAVIEAPTGEGKTEAAMFLADAWNTALDQNGYYFALPTQATSNQMFIRAGNFLKNRFPERDVQLQLLHGHASLSAEFETLKEEFRKIRDVFDDQCEGDECVPSVVAAEWFTYRKRGLLAPFGVGTVDQALMAVLQTKHVFVRLFGLAHKTVIIDEVHAYDAYMSTLLERLLEWLAALGSPVILLSATLPAERRNKLIEAYQRGLPAETRDAETRTSVSVSDKQEVSVSNKNDQGKYPRISYATDSEIKIRHIESSEKSRTLYLEKVDDDFLAKLKTKLEKDGGCAAIICNTVQRSQDVFDELKKDDFFKGVASDGLPKLDLLHARFRFIDREKREERVLKRFGKPEENGESPNRPKCAVLIATQIIEQSLDLDFDLMISDLAPVDLLLQRAGRLQRHDRDSDKIVEENKRPKIYRNKPTLWIIKPPTDENGLLKPDKKGLPDFGKAGVVYDKHILLRTWLELEKEENQKIEIPNEVEKLIEAVYETDIKYDGQDINIENFWQKSLAKYKKEMCKEETEAEKRWIAMPNAPLELYKLLGGEDEQLEEDSLGFHKHFKAMTRLNADSLTLVCLYRKKDKAFLDKDYKVEVDYKNVTLSKSLNEDEKKIVNENTKLLLGNSLSVIRRDLIIAVLESKKTDKPNEWKKSPLLKSCRVLWLNDDSTIEIENFFIYLHSELGLKVLKFTEEN